MNQHEQPRNWDWTVVIFTALAMYLIALIPFVQGGGGKKFVPSVFAVMMVWAWAYEKGYKIVWRQEGRWMAIFLFGIPCVVSLAGLFYAVYRFYIL